MSLPIYPFLNFILTLICLASRRKLIYQEMLTAEDVTLSEKCTFLASSPSVEQPVFYLTHRSINSAFLLSSKGPCNTSITFLKLSFII